MHSLHFYCPSLHFYCKKLDTYRVMIMWWSQKLEIQSSSWTFKMEKNWIPACLSVVQHASMNQTHSALCINHGQNTNQPRAHILMFLYSYFCPPSVTIIVIVSKPSFLRDWPNASRRNKVSSAVKRGLPVLDIWPQRNLSRYIYRTVWSKPKSSSILIVLFVLYESTWQVLLR